MTTPTILDRLAVVTLLAKPNPMGLVIAGNPHLTKGQVEQIAADAGYPKINDLRLTLAHLKAEADREKSLPVRTEPPEKGHRLRDDAHPTVHEPAPRNQHLVSSTPPPPTRPQPVGQPMRPYDATAQLLLEGKESGFKRTVALAERIEADLVRLRDALAVEKQKQREAEAAKARKAREAQEREQERQKALADVRRAEEALQAARAKLRGFKHTPGGNGAATTIRSQAPESRRPGGNTISSVLKERHAYYAAFIARHQIADHDFRAWAHVNGHKAGKFGLISRQVLDAYDAAHPAQAAS